MSDSSDFSDSTKFPVAYTVPEQAANSTREVSGQRLVPGTWWMTKKEWENLPEGTYVLLSKVEFADGFPHTLHLGEPPSAVSDERLKERYHDRYWRVLAADFNLLFSQATADEAMAARDKEISAIQGLIGDDNAGMSTAQASMMRLASTMQSMPTLALASPEPGTGQDSANALARQDMARNAGASMTAQAAAIRAASSDIALATARIALSTTRMGLYYAERSRAAMASVQPAMMIAERLGEQVDTMGMYVGHDVEATLLVDGASAGAEERLAILQRRLYMDEELLIHLQDGGADFEDVNSIASCMRADPSLIDRIFGAPRAVVAMAARRNSKDYRKGEEPASMGQAMEDAWRNMANKATFLLVRDGDRVWVVDMPSSLHHLTRMFPTPSDLEAPYTERAWFRDEPKRIGPDDLGYAKATEEFRTLGILYERVLLLLWGLHDRLGIFGSFTDDCEGSNFMNPDFQQKRFRLVFDDQMLLGRGMPTYRTWLAGKNKGLCSGSRVAVNWRTLLTYRTAPSVVEEVRRDYGSTRERFKAQPVHESSVVVVRRDAQDMVVECPVTREFFNRETYMHDIKGFNARVCLSNWTSTNTFAFLVLDDVDPADIDYYLSARSEREHYIDYVPCLIAARNSLRADAAYEKPAMDYFLHAVDAAGLPQQAPDKDLPAAIHEAIRDWRTANRGASLPLPGDTAWSRVSTIIMDKIWIAAGKSNEAAIADAVADACRHRQLVPIRVVRDGRNTLLAYAGSSPDELAALEEMLGAWPYVQRMVFKVARDGSVKLERSSEVVIPSGAQVAGERLIGEFAAMPRAGHTHAASARNLREMAETVRVVCDNDSVICLPNDEVDQEIVARVLHAVTYQCRHNSAMTRMVDRISLIQPASLEMERYRVDHELPTRDRVLLTGIAEDGWTWVARHAHGELRSILERDIGSLYRHPETHLASLPELGAPADIRTFSWAADLNVLNTLADANGFMMAPGDARLAWVREDDNSTTGWEMLLREQQRDAREAQKTRMSQGVVHVWHSVDAQSKLSRIHRVPVQTQDTEKAPSP